MFLIKFFVLLLLSAFFSGTETALTSLSDYKIRKLYNKYK
ncbi:MAG: CNNM domain-containing protein, partial [Endomicrobiia bacterium]